MALFHPLHPASGICSDSLSLCSQVVASLPFPRFMASWLPSLQLRIVSPALFSHSNTGAASSTTTTTFRPPAATASKLISCCAVGPTADNAESSEPESEAQTGPVDPVKVAFIKARAYKGSVKLNSTLGDSNVTEQGAAESESTAKKENVVVDDGGGKKDLPVSVKIAMEKAKKYKQNKGIVAPQTETTTPGLQGGKKGMDSGGGKKRELSVSRMDFVGLDFADKKTTRGLPPGLVPISDTFSTGDLPEVELIVGDTSKFDAATSSKPEQAKEDESELYKPKVSTWGVFPRPSNISKTFGGGRVIRPGEVLETEEEKTAKEARTKQLLAAYKKKIGLSIDPKLKSECEEALKEGDLLMNSGKLKEALPYYEKVMDNLTFQSELHGLAALQWSICQDSLSRPNEARSIYEKLQSHPNAEVNKKARQFVYSFQAMEMMKVTTGSPFYLKNTGYQNYFDAFVEDKSNYPSEDGVVQENAMNQVFLYILFLVSPILIVLLIAVQKRI